MENTTKHIHTVKFTFNKEHIAGAGQYVVRTNRASIDDDGFLSTIMYKVGYVNGLKEVNTSCLISMSDGWVRLLDAETSILDTLNNTEGTEGGSYRMATRDEVLRVVSHQKRRWLESL